MDYEIKEVIKIFKEMLPEYELAYEDNYSWNELFLYNLDLGFCRFSFCLTGISLYELFSEVGYYKNYVNRDCKLYPFPKSGKDLKTRIDFLKREIKSLTRLQKLGYTHI